MRITDLSLPIDNSTQVPPSQLRKVQIETVWKQPGYWQASWISFGAHTASHVDSPLHVVQGAPFIGEIPLDKVIGEAVILDLMSKGYDNAVIGPEDLEPFADDICEGDIVIMRTDWAAKKWNSPDLSYWLESPVLSVEGAQWLVQKKPKAVVFDCFEEYGARLPNFKPDDFAMHKVILGAGIIIIEGVINLDQLKNKRVKFFAVPLKIMNTEAAPARIFAIEE